MKYFDLERAGFHEKPRSIRSIVSYTWVKLALQGAGLMAGVRKRGAPQAPAEATAPGGAPVHGRQPPPLVTCW
jgi:hypothetical protein